MKRVLPKWAQHPPETFSEKVALLKSKQHLINDNTPEAAFLRSLHKEVKETFNAARPAAKAKDPFQFCKPSYEQMLALNLWLYGIVWIGIYTCNRMGKTAVCWWNFLLWVFPNKPKWKIFRSYRVGDHDPDPDVPKEDPNNPNWGKLVEVLQRPDIATVRKIHKLIQRLPDGFPRPDPGKPHYDPVNAPYLQLLQKYIPEAFQSQYPNPPWDKSGICWYGGPDHDHFKNIIMPIWKEWLPQGTIARESETDRTIVFDVNFVPAKKTLKSHASIQPTLQGMPEQEGAIKSNTWKVIGKSFDAKTDKWASGAVDAILITEGMPPDKWKEIKARFKDPAIGSHDYTPTDPENVGSCVALASRIHRGVEKMPLSSYTFQGWSVHTAPRHIMSEDKYRGLVETYANDSEREARLEGKFYASSGRVLSHLNRELHLLDWTIEQTRMRFPKAQLARGIDPGIDHPTACAWGFLLPTNQWIIYRILCQTGLSIPDRCQKIIEMSNNRTEKVKFGFREEDFYLQEVHPNKEKSEVFIASPIDYHTFQVDEVTGQSYALNYQTSGLPITESTHMRPEDRALLLDSLLKPSPFYPDLKTGVPPGPRVYFLKNSPGVMEMFLKWEELFWDRIRGGDNKGQPKDKVPAHGDDELDAVCYIACSGFKWTDYQPPARLPKDSEPEKRLTAAAQIQQRLRRSSLYTLPDSVLQSLQKGDQAPVTMFGGETSDEKEGSSMSDFAKILRQY